MVLVDRCVGVAVRHPVDVVPGARHQLDRRPQSVLIAVAVDLDGLRLDFDRSPVLVHQQLIGLALRILRPGEYLLDRLRLVYIAADDPAGQSHHQVVAVVPKCCQPVLGKLALDGKGAQEPPGHRLEGVGLQGIPVGREDDPDRPGLADAPGPVRSMPHGVCRPASVSAW